ncbi:MAG: CDP-glucose 4,6-dehydratase [Eubacteriales bacterium]
MDGMVMVSYFKGKKVLLTGHTGFKGSWLSCVLLAAGAEVCGYALAPTEPSLFNLCALGGRMQSHTGDIRDLEKLRSAYNSFNPEFVIHMAAQPLVIDSYRDPTYTYDVNVMGTVNILECVRSATDTKAFLNVTTDKVYRNNEWHWGYREDDVLCGQDPYSNSKSCSELVTYSYRRSFFENNQTAIATARAGNVIGGGDFAENRIIPDCVRAAMNNRKIIVRNKDSIRPWQHVLEPLRGYLMLLKALAETGSHYGGAYNIGPEDADCVPVETLVSLFCTYWPDAQWEYQPQPDAVHEANFLKLDCSKIKNELGYSPKWNIEAAIKKSAEWSLAYAGQGNMLDVTMAQIKDYFEM